MEETRMEFVEQFAGILGIIIVIEFNTNDLFADVAIYEDVDWNRRAGSHDQCDDTFFTY